MSLSLHYLPDAQFTETHSIAIQAEPSGILDAVERLAPSDDPLVARLMGLREVPARLLGLLDPSDPFGLHNFVRLERTISELAFGLAGRFWRPDFGLVRLDSAEAFRAFAEPGVAKLVLSYTVEPALPQIMQLTTRTRVFCPDLATRLKMMPYWLAIRPVSGLIRKRTLRLVKAKAERLRQA
ncbi:DUF2867 domain-containing protein [Aureimonas sp. AU20]|uniref:DUF2867 domain-containing protein n=1 Tax=Aureimonas sp. AU20 TaxID=1349819 RepID=UPI00071F247B|nr:DUF2867 domain-containing protein [Aureimonas sp. AU20]ALN72519.1 hypothetical protein M673_07325 [Aureimonas sp. AU20]